MDGLLLTRGERIRKFGERTGLVAGPSLVFALVLLGPGEWVGAVFVTAAAGLTVLGLGPPRTRVGAAACGVVLLACIVALLLFAAWIVAHPAPS
jgi:hypothetical protein